MPKLKQRKYMGLMEHFYARVPNRPDVGCWEVLTTSPEKYVNTSYNGVVMGMHRHSYLIHIGEIPPGMFVCHKCDNTRCVRPDHLFLGTHAQNMADMVSKGRVSRLFGEANHSAKLSEATVRGIRADHAAGAGGYIRLGEKYGIPSGTVRNIVKRRTWDHLAP